MEFTDIPQNTVKRTANKIRLYTHPDKACGSNTVEDCDFRNLYALYLGNSIIGQMKDILGNEKVSLNFDTTAFNPRMEIAT
jgi:hypothetical protein